jgi:primosomal protein N' (replication factor Y)
MKTIEATLAAMRARQIDILVGTQMVTKGHDLPNVTLVGVVNADAALSIPDYRASERAFQLLVQVAGRAGRGESPGRVLIQTWDPEHPAIALSASHDVDAFVERELQDRRELGYPPYTHVALVRVEGGVQQETRTACAALARIARACAPVKENRVVVQGPAPAPIERLRSRWRFRLMLRARERRPLRLVLATVQRASASLPRGVRSAIDVDPVQLL